METKCPVCGAHGVPLPKLPRSLLSDGRTLDQPLRKASCLDCGAAYVDPRPDNDTVRGWYENGYSLATFAVCGAADRATRYAAWLATLLDFADVRDVLEIGAGGGALLAALRASWPHLVVTGLDPAADGQTVLRGVAADARLSGQFDLVLSVNVIEHAFDPGEFFEDAMAAMRPNGLQVLICPGAEPVNDELVFADHLTTFTERAIGRLAARVGLAVRSVVRAPAPLGAFVAYVLSRSGPTSVVEPISADGHVARAVYLEGWRALDDVLCARLPEGGCVAFGAGQAAAAVRAYAPSAWARIEALMLDDPTEAWPLNKPVARISGPVQIGTPLLILINARGQANCAERMRLQGWRAIRFDDLIGS